jgi:hypothetical protein
MRRTILRLAEHAKHAAHNGGVGSQPHVHEPAPFYRYSAIALGATTWFYLLYMAKKEGPVLLVRFLGGESLTDGRDGDIHLTIPADMVMTRSTTRMSIEPGCKL